MQNAMRDYDGLNVRLFLTELTHYIFATSIHRDARWQDKFFAISTTRKNRGLFTLEIRFWEDIIGLIKSDIKT